MGNLHYYHAPIGLTAGSDHTLVLDSLWSCLCYLGALNVVASLQLYKTFPNMAMFLNLQASKPPTMVISPSSINITVPGNVNVSVKDTSSNATKPAFTVGIVRLGSFLPSSFHSPSPFFLPSPPLSPLFFLSLLSSSLPPFPPSSISPLLLQAVNTFT